MCTTVQNSWQSCTRLLDVAGGLWFIGVGVCLGNLPGDPYKEELEWQAAVGNKLIAEGLIAPVPHHVQVGGVHADEQPNGCDSANASSRRTQQQIRHNKFDNATGVCPERFRWWQPWRNNVVEELRANKVHDTCKAEEKSDNNRHAIPECVIHDFLRERIAEQRLQMVMAMTR